MKVYNSDYNYDLKNIESALNKVYDEMATREGEAIILNLLDIIEKEKINEGK